MLKGMLTPCVRIASDPPDSNGNSNNHNNNNNNDNNNDNSIQIMVVIVIVIILLISIIVIIVVIVIVIVIIIVVAAVHMLYNWVQGVCFGYALGMIWVCFAYAFLRRCSYPTQCTILLYTAHCLSTHPPIHPSTDPEAHPRSIP